MGVEELGEEMGREKRGLRKGGMKGIVRDGVVWRKEVVVVGKKVKLGEVGILWMGVKVKGGGERKGELSVGK